MKQSLPNRLGYSYLTDDYLVIERYAHACTDKSWQQTESRSQVCIVT